MKGRTKKAEGQTPCKRRVRKNVGNNRTPGSGTLRSMAQEKDSGKWGKSVAGEKCGGGCMGCQETSVGTWSQNKDRC